MFTKGALFFIKQFEKQSLLIVSGVGSKYR